MIILLQQTNKGWRADMVDLPGTPPMGIGKTKEEAVASLFMQLLYPTSDWHHYMNFTMLKVHEVKDHA